MMVLLVGLHCIALMRKKKKIVIERAGFTLDSFSAPINRIGEVISLLGAIFARDGERGGMVSD